MQFLEPVVRDGSEHVVWQVDVLAVGQDAVADEQVDEEDAGIRQPAAAAVGVLHHLPQHHEQ